MDEGASTQEGAKMRHETSEVSEQVAENHANDDPQPQKKVKRNVAMHVGYVGTNYTGAVLATIV